jgi:GAF domain-containing protein
MRRLLAVGLVTLAGCGGDGEGGDAGAYRSSGDAICTDYRAAIAKLGAPTKVTEIGPYIEKALPVLTRTVARVEKLDPPSDLRDAFETFRDAAGQTLQRAEALRDAAQAADADEVQRLLAEATAATERRKDLARAAGLDACADL